MGFGRAFEPRWTKRWSIFGYFPRNTKNDRGFDSLNRVFNVSAIPKTTTSKQVTKNRIEGRKT
jgi:hypothetical protein